MNIFFAAITQALPFLPLALGISISYSLLKATDMTLEGSFVLGAAVFARLLTVGFSPLFSAVCALFSGACAGMMVSLIQRGGRIDPLLAGILATFILASGNLALMGRPNINLLSQTTLLSHAFDQSNAMGYLMVAVYCSALCLITILLIRTRFGLLLRALGDNPQHLQRLGANVEYYRIAGFALTNTLAAASGILTAQTIGYADIGMGFGMTITGIGAIILGQQLLCIFMKSHRRIGAEFIACVMGLLLYFIAINTLMRFNVDPVYLKMILGLILIVFLRGAVNGNGNTTKKRKAADHEKIAVIASEAKQPRKSGHYFSCGTRKTTRALQ